ncbi:MAG: protein kinase [Planctomycetaceae bacterium]|nr:protein kinase [Planctomycetaceae bacterium]
MGVVYRARYVKNDRQVAVKLLPEEVTDEIVLGRFDRELEILRKLRHPNIVHSFGGTTEGEHRFYAMEIVGGGSFDQLLKKRAPLPWELAVKYFQQMTSALAYAHSHEVTHRDIKPGNFLIATNGQLKLSDFGLATFASAQNLTAAGKTMGTFRYMSPEQIRGKNIGAKADLYSLGCVMFETLTGKPPFDGNSPAEILDQHLHKVPPRVSSIAFDCPSDLDELVSSLLQKDPGKRPANAEAVQQKLENISPVKMVNVTQASSAGDEPTIAAIDTPSVKKFELSLWTAPSWVVALVIAIPLILLAWTLHVHDRSVAAQMALQTWETAWKESNSAFRKEAAQALGKIGRYDHDTLEMLAEGLESSDPQVQEAALLGLQAAGGNAEEYQSQVHDLRQNSAEPYVRYQAEATEEALKGDAISQSGFLRSIILAFLGIALYLVYWVLGKKYAE